MASATLTRSANCDVGKTKPPGARRASTKDRCKAITQAVRQLIVEKGMEGLRTRDIADRVGINVATLHYHVPTKAALIELVAHSITIEFQNREQQSSHQNMTPPQLLRDKLDGFLDTLKNEPDLLHVISEFSERSRRDKFTAKTLDAMHNGWIEGFRQVLQAGVADGTFRPNVEPTQGAKLLVSALIGVTKLPTMNLSDYRAMLGELERAFLNSPPVES